jgi:ATP-dependent Clp protease ATP-binding subunit ClpX
MMWSILKGAARQRLGFRGRLRCSFCGRDADAVERLVAGASAYICDSCITDSVAVLQQHGGFALPDPDRRRPTH